MAKVYLVMGSGYGSEGKGSVVGYLADHLRPAAVVRTGGPNAGHSITIRRGIDQSSAIATRFAMRQIPCAWHTPNCKLIIGAGSLIKLAVLRDELALIDRENPAHGPVLIDEQAVIMDDDAGEQEDRLRMNAFNGSTSEGIGWTRSQYMLRKSTIAKNCDELKCVVGVQVIDTVQLLNDLVNDYPNGHPIIIESTQGFGLSLTLSGHFPFTTSRDLTPMQILNDVGLHWKGAVIPNKMIERGVYTIAVCRTFPIRVAGNSGPMKRELTWEEMSKVCGRDLVPEKTTVTKRVRRISWFDKDEIARMNMICRPDAYFLTFADYVDKDLYPEGDNLRLSPEEYRDKVLRSEPLNNWLWTYFNNAAGQRPSYVSVGPGWFVRYCGHQQDHIDFRIDSNPVLLPARQDAEVRE